MGEQRAATAGWEAGRAAAAAAVAEGTRVPEGAATKVAEGIRVPEGAAT